MNRFFGMMPSDCIEKEARFDTGNGLFLRIQAGSEGWTIIFADGGTEYRDICQSVEDNFKEAYEQARRYFPTLEKIESDFLEA